MLLQIVRVTEHLTGRWFFRIFPSAKTFLPAVNYTFQFFMVSLKNRIIISILACLSQKCELMGSHRSLSYSMSPQVSTTIHIIVADLNNTVACLVSAHPLISLSSSPLTKPFGIVIIVILHTNVSWLAFAGVRVKANLLNSPWTDGRYQQCWAVSILPAIFSTFRGLFQEQNYSWFLRHFHVPNLYYFSDKVQESV